MKRRALLVAAAAAGLGLSIVGAAASGLKPYEAAAFRQALERGAVVVHVHADWCPVCRAQRPTLEVLAKEPRFANVLFVSVNFDKDKDFLRSNRVANQSVVVVFKDGKEVLRLSGSTDAGQIREGVQKAL